MGVFLPQYHIVFRVTQIAANPLIPLVEKSNLRVQFIDNKMMNELPTFSVNCSQSQR